jgi:hypothetical protein
MSRKYESIDLLSLYTNGSTNGWNDFLNKCVVNMDINSLAKVRYQIQAGMDDLAKLKLNSDPIVVWYCRLVRSLENTARQIIRIKHPLPQDNPLWIKDPNQKDLKTFADVKKDRDFELAKFFRSSSY